MLLIIWKHTLNIREVGSQLPRSQRHFGTESKWKYLQTIFLLNFGGEPDYYFLLIFEARLFLNPLLSQFIFFLHIQRQDFFLNIPAPPHTHTPPPEDQMIDPLALSTFRHHSFSIKMILLFSFCFTIIKFNVLNVRKLGSFTIKIISESGIKVLDVGCGAANFTTGFAKMFPNSNFIGLDMSEKGLQLARENAIKYKLSNVEFVKGDCHKLLHYVQDQFDWIFIYDTLHDLYNPHKTLDKIYTALKDDGSFTLFEIGFHSNPTDNVGDMRAAKFYTYSMMSCLPSSMMAEPHVGYGACWGKEKVEEAVTDAKFKITGRCFNNKSPFVPLAFFHCIK